MEKIRGGENQRWRKSEVEKIRGGEKPEKTAKNEPQKKIKKFKKSIDNSKNACYNGLVRLRKGEHEKHQPKKSNVKKKEKRNEVKKHENRKQQQQQQQ